MRDKSNYIHTVSGKNLVEAYDKALVKLNKEGKIVPCNAYSTKYKEIVQKEIALALNVEDVENDALISKAFFCGERDLQNYLFEFLYGSRNFCVKAYESGKAPNFWPYTYPQRFEDQIDWLLDTLIFDKESRRVVLTVRDKDVDMNIDDPACLQLMQFKLRNNKLYMTAIMRSNDATQASGMNMFGFIHFQKMIAEKLKERAEEYIEIFKDMKRNTTDEEEKQNYQETIDYLKTFRKVKAKGYTHIANSYHAYGQAVSKEEFEKELLTEGKTFEDALKEGSVIPYGKDKYVIGEIRKLHTGANTIEKRSVEEMTYPYKIPDEYGYCWNKQMMDSSYDILVNNVIASAKSYDLLDLELFSRINSILDDFGLSYEVLKEECLKQGINLDKELEVQKVKVRTKTNKN